jgi:uncharacterized protein (DUF58 family)
MTTVPAGQATSRPWRPTRALRRGGALATVPLLAAVLIGQVELVLLAVPFAVGTALSLARRPVAAAQPSLSLDQPTSVENGEIRARVQVARDDDRVPLLCVVNTAVSEWIRLRHGAGHFASLLGGADTSTVRLTGTAKRWGPQRIGPATVRLSACDGLLVAERAVLPPAPLSVYPRTDMFDSAEMLPRASGISGVHRSRRPGTDGELADVRLFQTGDRLRRINWRVTRRTGDIHVNSTLSERDADVVLVLDTRHEAGVSGGVDGPDSVADATVRAAAAITEHYTRQGDRVALVEFGTRLRRLRAGTGRRHHLAALEWLVRLNIDARDMGRAYTPGSRLFSTVLQPPGALIVVLTPMLDAESANMLAVLVRAGRSMVAVDTLPEQIRPAYHGPWSPAGVRLWRLERQNTIDRLRSVGVPVEPWRGRGSLDQMLRHVSRLAATSRVLAR